MAKYGMSLCVLGMAKEFEEDGIAVNALWPRTGTLHHNKVMFYMVIDILMCLLLNVIYYNNFLLHLYKQS